MSNAKNIIGTATLADKAYDTIKNMIIEQKLLPSQPLSERSLGDILGISRTPVRSAIARLERESFVTRIPGSGVIVSPIGLKEVHDVFELREILEVYSLEKGFSRPENTQLEKLLEEFREMASRSELSMQEVLRADEEFHIFIAQAGGNQWIVKMLELVLQRSLVMRSVSTSYVGRPWKIFEEHSALIEFWQMGDKKATIKALKEHIRQSKNAVLQLGNE